MPLILSGSAGLSGNIGTTTKEMLPAGSVLQVVQAVLTTPFYTNSNGTFVDVTGLMASITPLAATSKFLLTAQVLYSADFNANPCLRFAGGNAGNYVGDARGSRRRVGWGGGNDYFNGASATVSNQLAFTAHMSYLDSPNTTSPIIYKLQAMGDANGGIYLNRDVEDVDLSGEGFTGASSLTIMEIKG